MTQVSIKQRIVTKSLQFYWRRSRALTLGVRVLAVDGEGRVALVRHTYRPGWFLPGGGVEKNETAELAAARELEEEAGARPLTPLRLVGVFANFAHFPNDHVLLYRADAIEVTARPPDREIAEVAWLSPADLPADATPATKRRIASAFFGAADGDMW